ncbi:hypothetical protein NC653_002412 [Populus alba x Populus x berolinensis]|uniref:Uncharacterized protein n=1 Tax=Populus alba x Populus x berolinensis TaxID=444605 RepID=A0AAD6RNU0_9ROSI|nr:hypothetical protein NC653_002412 [Populus alba x Populus x berolinensis]
MAKRGRLIMRELGEYVEISLWESYDRWASLIMNVICDVEAGFSFGTMYGPWNRTLDPISSLTSAPHFNSLFTLVIYWLMDVLSLMDLLFPPLEFYATSHKQLLDISSPDTDAGSTMREFEELNKTFKS